MHSIWRFVGNNIWKNPFPYATLPEHHEKKRKVLAPEQVLKILDFTCRPVYYDYYTMHCAVLLAIACTVRGGEIGGLQWDRIYFDKELVSVDRVIDRVDKKLMDKLSKMDILFKFPNLYHGARTAIVLKQPKTQGSIRDIEIPQSTLQALSILKEMQEKLIFHSLRHTSTTYKLKLYGNIKAVQGDTGHAQATMVTNQYAHILNEDRRFNAQIFDKAFYLIISQQKLRSGTSFRSIDFS